MTTKSLLGQLNDLSHTIDDAQEQLYNITQLFFQYHMPAPYIATLKAAAPDLRAVWETIHDLANSLEPQPADPKL